MIINNSIEEFQFDGEAMDVLAESPMELSRQTIKSQIDKPESTQDHLIGIIEKIDRTLEIYGGNESDALEIKYNKQEILMYVLDLISKKFNIGVDCDPENLDELETITYSLYDALILHFKDNMENFFLNFIELHKEELINEYEYLKVKKDLSGTLFKQQYPNIDAEDYIIMVALPKIVKDIYDMNNISISPIEYLEISSCDKLFSGSTVKELYECGRICGSFVDEYMNLLKGEMEIYKQELFSNILFTMNNRIQAKSK